MMQTSGSLQELIEFATVQVQKMTEAQKMEYRQGITQAFERRAAEIRLLKQEPHNDALRLTESDIRWLRENKVDPVGD